MFLMKKVLLSIFALFLAISVSKAQIYAPEGINMPGGWNGWMFPLPAQYKLNDGSATPPQRKTFQSVSAYITGISTAGGTYPFLFTSGPSSNYYNNKWAGTNVTMNTVQSYTRNTGADNNITVVTGKVYVMNFWDNGYNGSKAIFMELSGLPAAVTTVNGPTGTVPTTARTVNISLSGAAATEQLVKIAYTTNNWTTRSYVNATATGGFVANDYEATIPGQTSGTTVQYYAFTTTQASPSTSSPDAQLAVIGMTATEYTYTTSSSLAVSLSGIAATNQNQSNLVTWSTASETDNNRFEVERSNNISTFNKLGEVTAKAGAAEAVRNYTFADNAPLAGINYYRLKMIDNYGNATYSKVVSVNNSGKGGRLALTPNPARDVMTVALSADRDGDVLVQVIDIVGRTVVSEKRSLAKGDNQLPVHVAHLPNGSYFINVNGQVAKFQKN
jgi:hypothetical protein